MRDNIRKTVLKAFLVNLPDSRQLRDKIVDIEEGKYATLILYIALWNETKGIDINYTKKARLLIPNLKRNEELRKVIIEGTITPTQLATMDAHKMAQSEIKKKRDAQETDIINGKRTDWIKQQLKNSKDRKKGFYQCPACRSWYTDFYLQQTRSADEPMTTFASCLDCDKSWKF